MWTSFQTITPGIRPLGSDVNDQSRIMTPSEALSQGTDYMVLVALLQLQRTQDQQ